MAKKKTVRKTTSVQFIPGYGEFELDLEIAIREQLPPLFEKIEAAPLLPENVDDIDPEAQGAYQLFLGEDLVYVGKSDAKAGLHKRLKRHFYAVQHRPDLNASIVRFKAIRIYSFNVMDIETILIDFYSAKNEGASLEWNGSGFGSNNPGVSRDTQKTSKFDTKYPISIDIPLPLPPHGLPNPCSVAKTLKWLCRQLPYTLRVESNSELNSVYVDTNAFFPADVTMRSVLTSVIAFLPNGWQATALKGYCLLYKHHRTYPAPTLILHST